MIAKNPASPPVIAMIRSDTWPRWRIGTLLSPAIAPQSAGEGRHGQAHRLLRFVELALDLSGIEALRGHRQEAQCSCHHLAGRFRLGVRRIGWPAVTPAGAAASGLSHDGAEALARSSRRAAHARAQVLSGQ